MGLSQKEVAERMDVTPAAISQYLSEKRGEKQLPPIIPEVKEFIHEFAKEVKDGVGKEELILGICGICDQIKASKKLCKMHDISPTCSICLDRIKR